MTRDEALAKLRPMEATLRARGIEALYLFGSVARCSADDHSDVDLLFDVEHDDRFSLLDQCKIQVDLSDELRLPVDFIERKALRPAIRARVETDLVQVFGREG